ncbi:hypothetical protein D3C81_803340 [compost metagenome]
MSVGLIFAPSGLMIPSTKYKGPLPPFNVEVPRTWILPVAPGAPPPSLVTSTPAACPCKASKMLIGWRSSIFFALTEDIAPVRSRFLTALP